MPVIHLAGRTADRATYDALIALARNTTNTAERVALQRRRRGARSGAGAGDARDDADRRRADQPRRRRHQHRGGGGEHPDLAFAFVRTNFETLAARQGPLFRYNFVSNLMTNFTDAAHVKQLSEFAPVHETSGGRIVAARAEDEMLTDADFIAHVLPAIDDWVGRRAANP